MASDRPGTQHPGPRDDDGDAVLIHTCSRIGMRANPPGRRLGLGWLRRA